jgi:hypothetical protein
MVQGNVYAMGPIHSTNSDEESSLRLVRQEVEKLFAMDSHSHRPLRFKGHQNSNRWNILRFLESVKKETILSDEKLDVTAASSCSSSPNMPIFPQLGQNRRNIEDSCENLMIVNTQSPQYLRPEMHVLKKNQLRDLSVNGDCNKESQVSRVAGFDHSTTTVDNGCSVTMSKGRSRPIPVSRRRVSPTNVMNNEESYIDDTAEENHLKQIYDLRTWEMYIRISEARKKAAKSKMVFDNRSRCISHTTATTTVNHASVVQMPHIGSTLPGQNFNMKNIHMIPFLPKEDALGEQATFLPSPASEHEMIFGDLDD